jgi:hypothetical protein
VFETEKPQALSRCGSPGSKMYGYEMYRAAPVTDVAPTQIEKTFNCRVAAAPPSIIRSANSNFNRSIKFR